MVKLKKDNLIMNLPIGSSQLIDELILDIAYDYAYLDNNNI